VFLHTSISIGIGVAKQNFCGKEGSTFCGKAMFSNLENCLCIGLEKKCFIRGALLLNVSRGLCLHSKGALRNPFHSTSKKLFEQK
jgi:hypothetical protein